MLVFGVCRGVNPLALAKATNKQEIFERACLAGQVNRMGGFDLASHVFSSANWLH
ncbi:hypothetical protein JW960_03465 [candidate division KSB1 bacterium]|nr:hypothetical protein [candidate division KSB1 bacterium]